MMTGYGKDSGGESWKPNAATLATLHEQQQKLQSCQSGYIQQAMKKYSNMPVTKKVLEQGGANGMYVTSKEGILGQVRCSLFFFNRKLCWFFWRYFGCEKSDTFSYDFHLLSSTFISFHLLSSSFIYFHLFTFGSRCPLDHDSNARRPFVCYVRKICVGIGVWNSPAQQNVLANQKRRKFGGVIAILHARGGGLQGEKEGHACFLS